uniref:Uncharacterized protein n=1 Tax=Anguilla anguilla TaxID=7936 RepID=A0A0E9VDJ8_ANGAN
MLSLLTIIHVIPIYFSELNRERIPLSLWPIKSIKVGSDSHIVLVSGL